jgi:hypothetical protein
MEKRMSQHNLDPDLILLIGRLEGKLDALIAQNHRQANKLLELEDRLNKLEAYRSWLLGVASVVSLIASYVFSLIVK